MAIQKSYEEILNAILTDYTNQNPDIDVSEGSLVFIRATGLAAALYGLNKRSDYIESLPFPDQCGRSDLEHWATIYGIQSISSLSDGALLSAVLTAIRKPPAGGNSYDWARWAMEVSYNHGTWIEHTKTAVIFEGKRGLGSIDVVVTSDRVCSVDDYDPWEDDTLYAAGSIVTYNDMCWITYAGGTSNGTSPIDDTGITDWDIANDAPSSELLTAIRNYINTKRPVGISDFIVYRAIKNLVTLTITVYGDVSDTQLVLIADETDTLILDTDSGGTLYIAQLISIAIENGADNVIIDPNDDLVAASGPTTYEKLWPYSITVERGV